MSRSTRSKYVQARENTIVQVTIAFGLTSNWLRIWREIFQQITLPTGWRSEIEIDTRGASRDLEKGMPGRTVNLQVSTQPVIRRFFLFFFLGVRSHQCR